LKSPIIIIFVVELLKLFALQKANEIFGGFHTDMIVRFAISFVRISISLSFVIFNNLISSLGLLKIALVKSSIFIEVIIKAGPKKGLLVVNFGFRLIVFGLQDLCLMVKILAV